MNYDINTHGDFRRYYDKTQKRNIWALGYFGGGSVNITEALEIGKLYANENNVPINTVVIDEILHSRRFKHFKIIYSQDKQEQSEKVKETDSIDNVFQWLTA